MGRYNLIATATFGLEAVVARELRELGYDDLEVENGKVSFTGGEKDIARCNLWLRSADRVLLKMAEFKAVTFEELFQGALAVDWGEYIPKNGRMHVVGKSVKSTLFSVPDCQAIVKKAVVEKMKKKYPVKWFSEDGPDYKIEVALLKDVVTLTMDTSGPGLHKRGYRKTAGEAPLKETLAAAMVLLSRWQPQRFLTDPFCGSGTILIEAALVGKNIPPGLRRSFAAESWPFIPAAVWRSVREEANALANANEADFLLVGYDMDGRVLQKARANAEQAGVGRYIDFHRQAFTEFSSGKKYGCVVTNPPYGERISEKQEVEALYREMGRRFSSLPTWSFFILTPHPEFQKIFGKPADKNRKLYNGRIRCFYYHYFGPLPPRKRQNGEK